MMRIGEVKSIASAPLHLYPTTIGGWEPSTLHHPTRSPRLYGKPASASASAFASAPKLLPKRTSSMADPMSNLTTNLHVALYKPHPPFPSPAHENNRKAGQITDVLPIL